jgi:hypothetical protein
VANLVLPRVLAMVPCDDVDRSDQERGVYHLTGVRTTMGFASFPAVRSGFCVFLHMSGHQGAAECHVQIFHAATDDLIYQSKPKAVNFKAPTSIVPVQFRLRNCAFPMPGVYFLEMVADSKVVGERRLEVRREE